MSNEYLITIKGKRRGSPDRRGPIRGGRRSEYLARRLRGGDFAPFIVSHEVLTIVKGLDATYAFNDDVRVPSSEAGNWPYMVREGDILAFFLYSTAGYSITNLGWNIRSSGDYSIAWTRWQEGDSRTVTFDVDGTAYDPLDPLVIPDYAEGFFVVLRNVKPGVDPFLNASFTTGSGTAVNFPSVNTSASLDLLLNFTHHRGYDPSIVTFFTSETNPTATGTVVWEEFGGAAYDGDEVAYGLIVSDVEKKGSSGVTSVTAGASGAWTAVTVSLPRDAPKEPFAGICEGPHLAPRELPIVTDDIVIRAEVNGGTPAGWTLLAGSDVAEDTTTFKLFWKRWKDTDTPDWDVSGPFFYDPLVAVIRNASKGGVPFASSAVTKGTGTLATTGAPTAADGQFVMLLTMTNDSGAAKWRFNETTLDRFEMLRPFANSHTLACGYAQSAGPVGPFTSNLTYSQPWFSAVLVVKKR